MRFTLFIARRLYSDKPDRRPVTSLAVRIATVGVGVGLAVMIVSVCIVLGFKHAISEKVSGFAGQIEVYNATSDDSPMSLAIYTSDSVIRALESVPGVKHVQRVSTKFGILKTDQDYKGIVFKGLGPHYDHTFLGRHITEGKLPVYALGQNENEIVISSRLAKEMGLRLGDKVFAYFLEDNVRMRRFHVAGIYNTDMSQFDDNIVLTNLYTVNQLNGWDTYQSSNLELQLNDFAQLDQVYPRVVDVTRDLPAPIGGSYVAYTVKQLYAQIYDWLQLLNLNIWIILGLMIVLASLTMVSGLLILILEKTSTIGILKALGATGRSIRHIFIYYATFIIGRGLILGYALGLGLSFIQYQWHPITLNPEKYYVGHVPILFDWTWIVLLGIGTLVLCVLSLVVPSFVVSNIRPAKAIKFD